MKKNMMLLCACLVIGTCCVSSSSKAADFDVVNGLVGLNRDPFSRLIEITCLANGESEAAKIIRALYAMCLATYGWFIGIDQTARKDVGRTIACRNLQTTAAQYLNLPRSTVCEWRDRMDGTPKRPYFVDGVFKSKAVPASLHLNSIGRKILDSSVEILDDLEKTCFANVLVTPAKYCDCRGCKDPFRHRDCDKCKYPLVGSHIVNNIETCANKFYRFATACLKGEGAQERLNALLVDPRGI